MLQRGWIIAFYGITARFIWHLEVSFTHRYPRNDYGPDEATSITARYRKFVRERR